jgi:hypothetical protein
MDGNFFNDEEGFKKWVILVNDKIEKLEKAIDNLIKENENFKSKKEWTAKYFRK